VCVSRHVLRIVCAISGMPSAAWPDSSTNFHGVGLSMGLLKSALHAVLLVLSFVLTVGSPSPSAVAQEKPASVKSSSPPTKKSTSAERQSPTAALGETASGLLRRTQHGRLPTTTSPTPSPSPRTRSPTQRTAPEQPPKQRTPVRRAFRGALQTGGPTRFGFSSGRP
jgi:hypothetical protein